LVSAHIRSAAFARHHFRPKVVIRCAHGFRRINHRDIVLALRISRMAPRGEGGIHPRGLAGAQVSALVGILDGALAQLIGNLRLHE